MDINVSVRAIEKLVDYTASGIGSTASLFFSRMVARRGSDARLISAEGEARARRVLAESQASTMGIIAKAQADARATLVSHEAVVEGEIDFGALVDQRIKFQEQKRQSNIGSVVQQAALELGDKEVQDHKVDHDWTARFFSDTQDVSTEGMQQLYARILAGEVERPGSTSIKTLSILKDLDRSIAVLFGTLCSASVFLSLEGEDILDARVISLGGDANRNALRHLGLSFDNLNVLNEHGLIIADNTSRYDIRMCISTIGRNERQQKVVVRIPFRFQNRFWVLKPTTPRKTDAEYQASGVALTKAGRELSRVVDCQPMVEYREELKAFFMSEGLVMAEVDTWDLQVLNAKLQ